VWRAYLASLVSAWRFDPTPMLPLITAATTDIFAVVETLSPLPFAARLEAIAREALAEVPLPAETAPAPVTPVELVELAKGDFALLPLARGVARVQLWATLGAHHSLPLAFEGR
jgi:hypothetical protein